MANISVGDVVLGTFNGTMNGQRIMSTFTWGVSAITGGPHTQASAFVALKDKLNAAGELIEDFLDCVPTDYTLSSLWLQVLSPARYAKIQFTISRPGTWPVASLTSNIAASITRRGDRGRRKDVSRLQVPIGQDSLAIDGGFIQNDLLTALGALAGTAIAPVTSAAPVITYSPVIFNGPTAADVTPLTDYIVQDTVRVMSRRTVGRGI